MGDKPEAGGESAAASVERAWGEDLDGICASKGQSKGQLKRKRKRVVSASASSL